MMLVYSCHRILSVSQNVGPKNNHEIFGVQLKLVWSYHEIRGALLKLVWSYHEILCPTKIILELL